MRLFSSFPVCFLTDISSETNYIPSKVSPEAIKNEMQRETAGYTLYSALWKGQTH